MTAIYDRRSGQTHLVADPVPALLDALADGEADADMLAARLGLTGDERGVLVERLGELRAVGLVEPL